MMKIAIVMRLYFSENILYLRGYIQINLNAFYYYLDNVLVSKNHFFLFKHIRIPIHSTHFPLQKPTPNPQAENTN